MSARGVIEDEDEDAAPSDDALLSKPGGCFLLLLQPTCEDFNDTINGYVNFSCVGGRGVKEEPNVGEDACSKGRVGESIGPPELGSVAIKYGGATSAERKDEGWSGNGQKSHENVGKGEGIPGAWDRQASKCCCPGQNQQTVSECFVEVTRLATLYKRLMKNPNNHCSGTEDSSDDTDSDCDEDHCLLAIWKRWEKMKCLNRSQYSELETINTRIVDYLLNARKEDFEIFQKIDIRESFPLHNKKFKSKLHSVWTGWRNVFRPQPLGAIRLYFGEQVALYFAWMSLYTRMLGIAALVGLIVFIYGFCTSGADTVSKEVCQAKEVVMCPQCDKQCPYWRLSDTCSFAKINHMFDNMATVFFAVFMSVWAALFLEFWKRRNMALIARWELHTWGGEEDDLVLGLLTDALLLRKHEGAGRAHSGNAKQKENQRVVAPRPQKSWKTKLRLWFWVSLCSAVMIGMELGAAYLLVAFRVMLRQYFAHSGNGGISISSILVMGCSGALHFFFIEVLGKICKCLAMWLSKQEIGREKQQRTFALLYFIYQFINNFSSIFYVAFFLGRFNGRPGAYVRLFGKFRLEECHPSGCLVDLCTQLAIVLIMKQLFTNIKEYAIPVMRKSWLRSWSWGVDRSKQHLGPFMLTFEYLDMVLQFGYVTIFVVSFPLAPLLAFINDVFEIHLDAWKLCSNVRRPVAHRATNIGVWFNILKFIAILSVITNALVIAVSSDFIPRLYYTYLRQSPHSESDLQGYVQFSLSNFSVADFENQTEPDTTNLRPNEKPLKFCSYRAYREPPDHRDQYSNTMDFWKMMAARLVFIILFVHVNVFVQLLVAWLVPDVPMVIKRKVLDKKRRRYKRQLDAILAEEALGDERSEGPKRRPTKHQTTTQRRLHRESEV
uniref:anoctamin-9-like isoform X2 n=1 Tax=Myxine glutinosa TaxID=7769 RepID=UPI00358ECDAC